MSGNGEWRRVNGGIILTGSMILYLKFGDVWLHFSQVYWPSCSVTFLLQSAFGHAYNKQTNIQYSTAGSTEHTL